VCSKVKAMKTDFAIKPLCLVATLLLASLTLAACSTETNADAETLDGLNQGGVRELLGEPDSVQDFVLPADPFFGPQEILSSLVAAGDTVEEWRYEVGEDVQYVWFYGDASQDREGWRVVASAKVPKDAVY
jgi:hypothetical protein